MSKTTIPSGYRMPLSNNELQRAIELIHQEFQHSLCVRLNLHRVSAPLFVDGKTGLNDDLNGVERPVTFDIPDVGTDGQVVHSLAKWKRLALKRYEFSAGTGLYTNMNAIRRDEVVDNLHSIYVDQWDWEKVITREDRSEDYLRYTVRSIVGAVCDTCDALSSHQSREKKLEILKDSRVGAFAVLGCVSYLLLQYALWCQPGWEKEDLWVLALVPVLSRAMSGYGALTQPGARADGLLAAFTEQEQGRGRQRFLLFLCALLALAIGMLGVGCAAVAAAILVYLWYIQMARREFGGLTGDLAGWFLQVCELGCLAAMVLAREIAEVLI